MTALDGVADAMRRVHVPGVAVGTLRDGDEAIATFGVTSVENPLPVQPDTLFQIGSITKTVTATALMRLIEQGTLELEAPVRAAREPDVLDVLLGVEAPQRIHQ